MPKLTIKSVETFLTQPERSRHVIVKVTTSEPGLYGLGCATFTQRHLAVKAALDHHIGPLVTGQDPRNIEDLWHMGMVNGYWRNGPVLNNAVAGVDQALWDIKGKLANMPCYELWGGKCRPGAMIYAHADGKTPEEVTEKAREFINQGVLALRCQLGGYWGVRGGGIVKPDGAPDGAYFDPREKVVAIPQMFAHVRRALGDDVELLYDAHERLAPIDAVRLAKALEPWRLFFLEDLLPPEQADWFTQIRGACATPLAMGELFNRPSEMRNLIANRLIDFIRVHVSQIGGVTPALKLARLCEAFGVRTAWHGPLDTSPVGMAACIHLDVACHNFGIQEWMFRPEIEYEMFPGIPEYKAGYLYPNEKPGFGIEFDEALAAKFPCSDENPAWTVARLPDGTLWTP